MPRIPRIQPTLNTITNQPIGAQRRDPGASGDLISALGGAVSHYADMFQKAAMLRERTQAENSLDNKLNEINTRAAADNELTEENRKKYDDEINQAVHESSEFITTPQEKQIFSLEADSKANISKAHVQSNFMKKVISQGKAELDVFLANKKNDFIKAKSFAEKKQAVLEREDKIREMTDAGFLTPDEAIKLQQAQNKDWARTQVYYDIDTNPIMAKEMLEANEYEDISEADRAKLLKVANNAIKASSQQRKDDITRAQIQTEAEYLTNFAGGKYSWMTVNDIANDVKAGRIDDKFGMAMVDVINSDGDYQPREEENENYPQFVEAIYKSNNQEEMRATLIKILENNKNISRDKLSVLINGAMQRAPSLPLHGKGEKTPEQQNIEGGALAVTNFGRHNKMSNNEIAGLYENYLVELKAGKQPRDAYESTVRKYVISQHPESAAMSNPPNMILSEDSPIRVIFPKTGTTETKNAKPNAGTNNVSK